MRWLLRLVVVVALLAAAPTSAAAERGVFRGTVAVEHEDRGAGRSAEKVLLRSGPQTFRVRDGRLRAFAGRRVTLTAERSGRSLVRVRAIRAGAGAADHEDWFADPPREGERRVAVVLISDAADVARRWDPAETEAALFDSGDSVDQFFRASSGGTVTLGGAVHGWYTADLGTGCDTDHIARAGIQALRDDGVTLADFHHVMVHFPRRDCAFNGMAWINDPVSLINGRPSDRRLLSHELGHNFGLYHANSLSCTHEGAPVALSETCAEHEYGDPFSTMGNGFHRFHGAERERIGWTAPGRTLTVDRDGVYEIAGHDREGTEMLFVSRRIGTDWRLRTHLAVELRRPALPFDPFAPDDAAVTGVTVRLVNQIEYQGRWYTGTLKMQLLDATPGSPGGHRDAPLRVGETLIDERQRTAITLEAVDDGIARVRVGWVPSVPADVAARLDGPDAAEVSWSASEDDQGVEAYELERDGVVVGRTGGLNLRDAGLPPGRDVSYRVVAVDGHGNRRASAPVVVSTPAPAREDPAPTQDPPIVVAPAGRIAPVLTLRPTVGWLARRVPRDRRLTVTATDDAPGVRVEALLDRRLLARRVLLRTPSGRLVVRLPRAALRGRHRLVLRAVDAGGDGATLRIALRRGSMRRL